MEATALLIFSKGYNSIKAKTRLRSDKYPDYLITELHNAFLLDTIKKACLLQNLPVFLSLADQEDETVAKLKEFNYQQLRTFSQKGKTFADKLNHSVKKLLKKYYKIILIGSDCPYLKVKDLESALATIDKNQQAIGSNPDNGFYLLTLDKNMTIDFNFILKKENQTKAILSMNKNCDWSLLRVQQDIDNPSHLSELIKNYSSIDQELTKNILRKLKAKKN